jgi:hypothetical protein
MTNPNEDGLGGTAAGPTAVESDALHENVERIAVPAFDIVTAPVEGLVEPVADAMPDADEPETRPPLVDDRDDTEESVAAAPSDETTPPADQGEDRT